MNIRVIGEDGRLLAQGRNLQRLKEQFLLRAEAEPPAAGASSLLHQGLRAWSFGELPEWIELEQAGVKLRAFPGLVDKGDSVDVQLFEHPATAAQHSMAGLLRLILLELPQQRRHLSANLPRFSSYSLYYVTLGKAEELRTDLVDAIFRYRFVEGRPIPRNRMEFDQRLQLRADLMEMAEEVTACVEPVLFEHHRLKNRLNELRQRPALERSVRDAEQQLTRLVHQGFLCELPLTWLKAYPRFLKALALRLERLQPERENRVIDELDKFWEKYQTLSKATRASCCNALQTFRWMIEEYRVSLFAQSLGTSMPVSAKRLERQCLQVKANLEELT